MIRRQRLRDGRDIVLREATESDAAGLLECVNEVGAEEVYILSERVSNDLEAEAAWIRGFDGVRSVLFVAVGDGKVVGQADARIGTARKSAHTAILGIAIRKAWRGVGLGRLLMEALLDWMRERGVEKAWLEVFSTNDRAIALYRKLGFVEEGRKRRHFRVRGEYVDDVLMAKWLR